MATQYPSLFRMSPLSLRSRLEGQIAIVSRAGATCTKGAWGVKAGVVRLKNNEQLIIGWWSCKEKADRDRLGRDESRTAVCALGSGA